MKLISPSAEMAAIRSLTSSGSKIQGQLLAGLQPDYFVYEPAFDAFERIQTVAQTKSRIINWSELKTDPGLSEDSRKALSSYKKKPTATRKQAKRLVDRLSEFRRLRILADMTDEVAQTLKKPRVNVEKLASRATDMLTEARTRTDVQDQFMHTGVDSNAKAVIKSILKGNDFKFVPTGLKTFDGTNRGLMLSSLLVIGSTSGAGKSAMISQLNHNIGLYGFNTCVVPLEMDKYESSMRDLARLSKVTMTDLLDPANRFTAKQRKRIMEDWSKHDKRLRKKDVRSSYFVPDDDLTIDEILLLLKPYKYDVIFIDYIGLLAGVDSDDQWRVLGSICRVAKQFAKNNDCVVVLAAQMTSEGLVRYARSIKEHASNMWSWHNPDEEASEIILDVRQQKARNQRKFNMPLMFDFETMTIRDLTEKELKEWEGDNDESDGGDRGNQQGRTGGRGKRRRRRGKGNTGKKKDDYFADF